VPLGYESSTATAYVNQSTGIVVDQAITEPVTPTLSVDGTTARLVPVMATAMKAIPASVKFAADKAASASKLLMTAAPIGLYMLGLALIIVAIVRRRKPASTQAAVPGAAEALVHA
jgi:Porin PorA